MYACVVLLSGVKLISGSVMLVSVVLVAAGGSTQTSAPLRRRTAVAARRLARAMNDSLPAKTAQVYGPAPYRVALDAWSPAAQPLRRSAGHWYVIVIRGRFVWHGPFRPARGKFAARLWSPTTGNSGVGYSSLSRKLPPGMSHLGHPAIVSLG
jgi:hypothetical protein